MKFLKLLVAVLRTLTLFIGIVIAILIWQRPWYPFMDDGPFQGVKIQKLPERTPDQIYPFEEYRLIVYNATQTQKAPIVALSDKGGNTKWIIYATGMEGTEVSAVEFSDHRTIFSTTIRGVVVWSFGAETTLWYIGRDGELEEYWFSW